MLVVAVTAFVVLRLWNLTTYSLWGGETFGLVGARMSWSAMLDYIVEDVAHPPLFYVLLKLWLAVGGEGLLWLKLLPVVFAVASIGPLLLLCRELRLSQRATNLAIVLIAFNGYLIHYAQEVRGYSPLAFFALLSVWLFVRWRNREDRALGNAVALFLVNLLVIYTHYYGWLVVATEGVLVLLWARHRLIAFTLMGAALALAFLPWAMVVASEAAGRPPVAGWVPRPGLKGLGYLYANLNGPQPWPRSAKVGILVFWLPVAIWAWCVLRGKADRTVPDAIPFWCLASFAFVPVVALFVPSQLLWRSFFLDRYLIFVAVPYLLLVAAAVQRLSSPRLRVACTVALVIWCVSAGVRDVRTDRVAWESPQLGSRVHWRTLANRLSAAEPARQSGIPLYTLTVRSRGLTTGDWALSRSLAFFLGESGDQRFSPLFAETVEEVAVRSSADHFWVAYIQSDKARMSPPDVLVRQGYDVGQRLTVGRDGWQVVLISVSRDAGGRSASASVIES